MKALSILGAGSALSLGLFGLACGASGGSGSSAGAGGASTGAGAAGGAGAEAGSDVIAPTLANGQANPLAGDRPAQTELVPSVEDYAGSFNGFEVGRGLGLDPDFSGRPECREGCDDFPAEPIFEFGFTTNTEVFDLAPAGAGPCIVEPQDGAMFPANWTRPRLRLSGVAGNTQHRITVSAAQEANDLVVYTAQNLWIMPTEVWDGLRKNVYEQDVTIVVRSSTSGNAPTESVTRFRIAPVQAAGSIVFWASRSLYPGANTTQLLGFSPGDEAVISTLTPPEVQGTILDDGPRLKREIADGAGEPGVEGVPEGQVRCVGCHTSTPDGEAVAITDHWPWNSKLANITDDAGQKGGAPDYLTPMGDLLLQMPWQGTTTFSTGDWALGLRRVITSYEGRPVTEPTFNAADFQNNGQGAIYPHDQNTPDELAWIDLSAEGTVPQAGDLGANGQAIQLDQALPQAMVQAKGAGWDIIARTGDPRSAVTPDWSHDGQSVVYTSSDATADGHLGQAQVADIYTVPFNEGAGGTAEPLPGASTAGAFEYYPDYSADDQFVAFNRVNAAGVQGGQQVYYRPDSEIYVTRVGQGGGTPIRLAANDPPACSQFSSPGSGNSWAKWSPIVRSSVPDEAYSGRTYYFLTFASTRESPFTLGGNGMSGAAPASQLYIATMVVDRAGNVESYPAVYLWNQSFLTSDGSDVEPLSMSNLTPAWDEFVVPPIRVIIQ